VIVVTADHGASFVTGQPRRPVNAANAGVIAPVPFFVKEPGQRTGHVDDRAVRTIDVLPTIAKSAGVRLPWQPDGIPADERKVDPAAPIDLSHQGELVLTEPLGSILAKRAARDAVEAELLRNGVYEIGPRQEMIGHRVSAESRELMADDAAAVLPSFISGRADGLEPDTDLAIAVNGRVEATTRTYRDGGRSLYAALVPPSSLRHGPNTVAVLEILPDGELRSRKMGG
jgi:hypothetical protein